jgi:hypothetical protein
MMMMMMMMMAAAAFYLIIMLSILWCICQDKTTLGGGNIHIKLRNNGNNLEN